MNKPTHPQQIMAKDEVCLLRFLGGKKKNKKTDQEFHKKIARK